MDKNTLIVGDLYGEHLVKYTIDNTAKTCTAELMDSGYRVQTVTCEENGEVYVTEYVPGEIKVRIYNLNTGDSEVWSTNIQSADGEVHLTLNEEFIVISSNNDSYIYDKNRIFKYKVTHVQVPNFYLQTYLTDTGKFLGTAWEGFKLLIMDLDTRISKIITGGIARPQSVSGTRNGYVYVTDVNVANVGVYSRDGMFQHFLQIDKPRTGGDLKYSAGIRIGQEDFVAFSTWDKLMPIAVYKVHQ